MSVVKEDASRPITSFCGAPVASPASENAAARSMDSRVRARIKDAAARKVDRMMGKSDQDKEMLEP